MAETLFNELSPIYSYTTSVSDVIRVVLVDSHEAMREGLRQMLNGDETIKVIGEARNGKEALHQIQKLYPDILVLGIEMQETDGFKIIEQIKHSMNNIGIIVLSDDQSILVSTIKKGVAGFLSRNISRNELVSAIRIVYLWRSILFQDEDHFTLIKL